MSRSRHSLYLASVLLIGVAQSVSAQAIPAADTPTSDASALAAKIDQLVEKAAVAVRLTPAPLAEDSEFLRRIYLDLAGRIPSVAETRSFLADKQPDRRARVIDRLLAGPRYATHFAAIYRNLLIPEASNNFIVRLQQDSFESWLKKQLARNVGYDGLTRELLTESLGNGNDFEQIFGGTGSAQAFFAAKEYKPESLAAGTARIFLGVRVECAQCHNHPFADWERDQFWSMAAFFSGIEGKKQQDVILAGKESPYKKEITIPGSEKVIQAKFLDGTKPNWDKGDTTRAILADWVTSPTNPYFARAAVNRIWAYFLGTGLIEPIDEMIGTSIASSHPELLDLLAREFANHKFDMKFLIRSITLTQAYQRTSAGEKIKLDATRPDPIKYFVRMPLKGITAEQLFDSLAMATGFRDSGDSSPLIEVTGGKVSARAQFVTKFANQTERATMAQTSILQALSLMNGKVVTDATSLERSETLAAVVDAPFLTTAERMETLYLAAYARRPSARELERTTRFIDVAVRDARDRNVAYNQAVSDVFWALLNSSEFVLNH